MTTSQPPQSSSAARVRSVRGRATVTTSPATSSEQRRGEQPRDLTAELGVEHARRAGRAPLARRAAGAPPPTLPGLVAGQPAEAVVAEDQRSRSCCSASRRCTGGSTRATAATIATHQPAATSIASRRAARAGRSRRPSCGGPASRYTSPNAGQDEERLQHLGEEAEADERDRRARASGCCPSSSARGHRVRAGDEQQHEQRVGVVEAEHQRRDRRQREHRAGDQRRAPARTSAARSRRARRPRRRPSSACGTRMLHAFTPKMRAESSMTHSDAGVLSTVIEVRRRRTSRRRTPSSSSCRPAPRPSSTSSPSPTRRDPRGRARAVTASSASSAGRTHPGRRAARRCRTRSGAAPG